MNNLSSSAVQEYTPIETDNAKTANEDNVIATADLITGGASTKFDWSYAESTAFIETGSEFGYSRAERCMYKLLSPLDI